MAWGIPLSQAPVLVARLPADVSTEMLQVVAKAISHQQRSNRHWVVVAPRKHPFWKLRGLRRFLEDSRAHVTRASETVVSNNEWLAQSSTIAEPTGLATRIRRVVWEIDPTRFHTFEDKPNWTPACGAMDHVSTTPVDQEVYYLDYNQDHREWQEVMKLVDQVFRTSATQQITLTKGHDIRKRVEELIPWAIERVQIAKTPRARRMPPDIPYTHRATILLYNDDELVCESEDIGNVAFPRQRFSKGVRYAICAYGNAPTGPEDQATPEPPAVNEPEVPPGEVHGAGITFPGCDAPREIKRAVARLHANLGHPSAPDLIRMLSQQASVTPEAIKAAKCLSCTSCLRMRGNAPPRPSKTLKHFVGQLNDSVQMDIFYARSMKGENHILLGMVDEATNLQQVVRLPNREPLTVLSAFRTTWVRPFGMPSRVVLDQDGSFMGEFWTYLVDQSTEVDYVPPEAHHRLGKAERCNAVYREMLNRVVDSMAVVTDEDMELAIDATTHAINSMPRTRGMSAYAIVFGRVPRVPGELLTDDASLAATVPMEDHNRHTIIFRAEAQKAAAQVNVDQHIRRALLRKTAHMRVEDITPGAKCAVWRSRLRGKGPRKRGGYVIGRLVTFDGTCAWVQLGTQTVKVDRNQLRPAYGFEAWSPDTDDIKALKDAEQNFLSGELQSLEDAPPPEHEPVLPELVFPPETPAPSTPLPRILPEAARGTKRAPETPPASPASKRQSQREVSSLICEDGETQLRPNGWDGSEWEPDHPERLINLPEVFASEHEAPPLPDDEAGTIEDCHPSWQVCYVGDQRQLANAEKLTRKELKALNREVPWREIVAAGGITFRKYVESAQKEHEQWQTWAQVRPLSEKETAEVLADPILRTRVLKSRACYRDKAQGQGELRAKTRVVVLGHRDPDLHSINRDAPTPTRLTEQLLLAVYIAGRNKRFLNNGRCWRLWCADATTAFLQGRQDQGERPNKLYMLSPRDPILNAAGAFPATMYEINGNVYGLANAPRLWSLEVGKRLLSAGFRPHSLDRMCFLHYDSEGVLDCMALVYVDDFLVTYADSFDLETVTSLFKWGSTSSDKEVITFKGKQLHTAYQDGEYVLRITQTDYIRSLAPGKVTRQRARGEPQLDESEQQEFRSCCGALQWVVGQTRPDGAATVSLANKGNESTLEDLSALYRLMEYLQRTDTDGLTMYGVPLNPQSLLVTFGDCSWANAQNYRSQEGLLVCVTTPQALEGNAPAMLLDWKSTRTPRVVRSTLAGEAYAADDSIDRGVMTNQMFSEIIFGRDANPLSNLKLLRHLHATDCKSLYDATIAANFNTQEKRVGLTIRAIQETISPADMRWVPTTAMWADGLTKVNDALRSTFLDWLRRPTVQLRSETWRPSSVFSPCNGFWTNKMLGVSTCRCFLRTFTSVLLLAQNLQGPWV